MTVLAPCDANEVKKMVKAIIRYKGPVYVRINRNDLPVFTESGGDYEIGKMYPVFGQEGRNDVVIFASGVMVGNAVEAAERLSGEGVPVRVVNVSTLKPLAAGEILKYAAGAKLAVSAEESVKTGGLGQAIASVLLESPNPPLFRQLAIEDAFGTSAHTYEELLDRYGLSADHVYMTIKKALA
jgi:transketolase